MELQNGEGITITIDMVIDLQKDLMEMETIS